MNNEKLLQHKIEETKHRQYEKTSDFLRPPLIPLGTKQKEKKIAHHLIFIINFQLSSVNNPSKANRCIVSQSVSFACPFKHNFTVPSGII